MKLAETAISDAFEHGRDTGEWCLVDEAVRQFAVIATTYDAQLRRAPLSAVANASDRLDRLQRGEPSRSVARKRA